MYPVMIDPDNLQVVSYPLGLYPTIKDISDSSNCVSRESCTQKYSIFLGIDGACSFSGVYKFKFKYKCHPSITKDELCPLSEKDKNVEIVLDVNSENFCSSLNVNVDISGNIKSYKDDSYSNLKDIFLEEETSFFKVEVKSSQASIKETKVIRVHYEKGNLTTVLFDNSEITKDGVDSNLKIRNSASSTTATFQFDLAKLNLDAGSLTANSTQYLKVSALIAVRYESSDGSTFFSYSNSSLLRSVDLKGTTGSSQMTKCSNNIQLFQLYKPKHNGGSIFHSSCWLTVMLLLVMIIEV
jgi:hypothetical protein